jgi:hypothetical protein
VEGIRCNCEAYARRFRGVCAAFARRLRGICAAFARRLCLADWFAILLQSLYNRISLVFRSFGTASHSFRTRLAITFLSRCIVLRSFCALFEVPSQSLWNRFRSDSDSFLIRFTVACYRIAIVLHSLRTRFALFLRSLLRFISLLFFAPFALFLQSLRFALRSFKIVLHSSRTLTLFT